MPDPEPIRIPPEQIQRIPPEQDPYYRAPPPPPGHPYETGLPLPPLVSPEVRDRLRALTRHPFAQALLQRLRGRTPGSLAGAAPQAPSAPPPRVSRPAGGVPVPVTPEAVGRSAMRYLLAGLAGAVVTGVAVVAYTAATQSAYEQGQQDASRTRNRRRRRRRKRNRRKHQRVQEA